MFLEEDQMPYEEDEFPSDFSYAKAMRDPADDGPEVEIIRFFRKHPDGISGGIDFCFHTGDQGDYEIHTR